MKRSKIRLLRPVMVIVFVLLITFVIVRIFMPRHILFEGVAFHYDGYAVSHAETVLDISVRRTVTLALRLYGVVLFDGVEYISVYDIREAGDVVITGGAIAPNTFLPLRYATDIELAVIDAAGVRQIKITPGGNRFFPRFNSFTVIVDGEREYLLVD